MKSVKSAKPVRSVSSVMSVRSVRSVRSVCMCEYVSRGKGEGKERDVGK